MGPNQGMGTPNQVTPPPPPPPPAYRPKRKGPDMAAAKYVIPIHSLTQLQDLRRVVNIAETSALAGGVMMDSDGSFVTIAASGTIAAQIQFWANISTPPWVYPWEIPVALLRAALRAPLRVGGTITIAPMSGRVTIQLTKTGPVTLTGKATKLSPDTLDRMGLWASGRRHTGHIAIEKHVRDLVMDTLGPCKWFAVTQPARMSVSAYPLVFSASDRAVGVYRIEGS